jgi:hypothetical protein
MAFLRVSEDAHRLIKIEAAKRDTDMGELVERAVKALTGDLAAFGELGPPRVDKVQQILRSGDYEVIQVLFSTIDFLFDRLRNSDPKP